MILGNKINIFTQIHSVDRTHFHFHSIFIPLHSTAQCSLFMLASLSLASRNHSARSLVALFSFLPSSSLALTLFPHAFFLNHIDSFHSLSFSLSPSVSTCVLLSFSATVTTSLFQFNFKSFAGREQFSLIAHRSFCSFTDSHTFYSFLLLRLNILSHERQCTRINNEVCVTVKWATFYQVNSDREVLLRSFNRQTLKTTLSVG